ncbi:hypothetical protein DK389_15995 [Methylobacterium durans]|uniref:Glycosyltransferase subfamily 4-like N-terminal domain-containing protein n=1 Tax=Methylobacterium durans TaxID=2202825 RepID=A0A2U8W6N5_9HYPH|nr:glycosyltransferase family 4 protein [Methylobacterium durans]AWN41737.1 hypothetical protein DK389_15995 [Methylobacterium durans]
MTLARGLKAAGFETIVCGEATRNLARLWTEAASHGLQRTRGPIGYWRDCSERERFQHQHDAASRIIEDIRPDLLIVPYPWPDSGAGIACAAVEADIPVISIFHLFRPNAELSPFMGAQLRKLADAGEPLIAVSDVVADALSSSSGIPRRRFSVIRNGVYVEEQYLSLTEEKIEDNKLRLLEELGLPPGSIIACTVARVDAQKGYLDFVQVVKEASAKWPRVHFLWVGDGPDMKNLKQQLVDAGVATRVSLMGWRDDPLRFIATSDIFLQTSHFEGLSLSLLEAARLKKPIVTTSPGGLEIIAPNRSHLYVEQSGDCSAIAESIVQLSSGPALRRLLQRNLSELTSELSDEVMVEKYAVTLRAAMDRGLMTAKSPVAVEPIFFCTNSMTTARALTVSKNYLNESLCPRLFIENCASISSFDGALNYFNNAVDLNDCNLADVLGDLSAEQKPLCVSFNYLWPRGMLRSSISLPAATVRMRL